MFIGCKVGRCFLDDTDVNGAEIDRLDRHLFYMTKLTYKLVYGRKAQPYCRRKDTQHAMFRILPTAKGRR